MRRATITNSLTKGVLDPDLAADRTDLAHYWQSLYDGVNGLVTPQGGFKDRGGFKLVSDADILAAGLPRRLRRRMIPVHLTSGMITALAGGDATALVDQDPATTFAAGTVGISPFPAVEVDLGDAVAIAAVDVVAFKCDGDPINECVGVEYFEGGAWHTFGGALDNAAKKHIRTTARTRRFAGVPGVTVTARYWRVALTGAVGAGAITIGGLRMWREIASVSPVMPLSMARSTGEVYTVILTERNIDVFRNHRWQAAIPVAIAGQQVVEMWPEASLDTLVLFHEMIETIRVVRQGSDGEWDAGVAPYANTPPLTAGTAFSGDQDEVQLLDLSAVADGASITLALGDAFAAPFAYAPATFAADCAAALGALPGLTAGDFLVTDTGGETWRVAFVDDNGSRAWPLLTAIVDGASSQPSTTVAQAGLKSTDGLLFSAETGWPRCGKFVQSRLLTAGYRGAPTTWGVSVVGQFYDHTHTGSPLTADKAFFRAIDTDQIETIEAVFIGRHLQFFTAGGEWYVETRSFDATQPVNVIKTTNHGIKSGTPLAFADGATLFAQKGGKVLRDFLWTDTEQSYRAEPVNILAPHLLTDVVSLAHRQARDIGEGNQMFMANADGSAVALTLLRSQEVQAMIPWRHAAGAFRGFTVGVDHVLYAVVEYGGDLWLEKWQPTIPLDAATHYQGAAATTFSGLTHLANRTDVWAIADDELVGPLTVSAAGVVTLDTAAADVWIGLEPAFFGQGQVMREKPNESPPFRLPARIYEIELDVVSTGAISFSTNGKSYEAIPVTRAGDAFVDGGPQQTADGGAPGLPMMQRLYTGKLRRQGMTGWTKHPYGAFSRPYPAPVHVRSIRYEVANRG